MKRLSALLTEMELRILTDIDIATQLDFHCKHGKLATVTTVQPPGRYGVLLREGTSVQGFQEKPPVMGLGSMGGSSCSIPKSLTTSMAIKARGKGALLKRLPAGAIGSVRAPRLLAAHGHAA